MPLLHLAQFDQPLHIVEDTAQIPCRGHAARSGFKIVIISITNINMIPVIMVISTIAKILILLHQDFNDFSMRGSFRFVNTLCTDSTLTRCLLLIFPLEMYISGNIMMMVISNLRNCPIYHKSERENQVDGDDDDEEDEGDKLS